MGQRQGQHRGLLFEDLLAMASKALVVQTGSQLSTYLKELEDQRLVSVVSDAGKQKRVLIQLSRETLERLAN